MLLMAMLMMLIGVTSVMMARGAMWNVSLFKHGLGEAPLPPYEVYRAYLKQVVALTFHLNITIKHFNPGSRVKQHVC